MEQFLAKSKAQPGPKANGKPPIASPSAMDQPIAGRFWKFAIIFSFVLNAILVLVLLVLGLMIFQIKNSLAQPIIGGLHSNFIQMDEASIVTTIPVNDIITVSDTIPVVFDLPLNQQTTVTLVEATVIPNTTVYLNGVPIRTDIILPQGTPLNINLNLTVPVSQTIPVVLKVPVALQVPVNIPLSQTDLHTPFTNLAAIVAPYNEMLANLPSSWGQALTGQK
jgi:hypothetical protein